MSSDNINNSPVEQIKVYPRTLKEFQAAIESRVKSGNLKLLSAMPRKYDGVITSVTVTYRYLTEEDDVFMKALAEDLNEIIVMKTVSGEDTGKAIGIVTRKYRVKIKKVWPKPRFGRMKLEIRGSQAEALAAWNSL